MNEDNLKGDSRKNLRAKLTDSQPETQFGVQVSDVQPEATVLQGDFDISRDQYSDRGLVLL